MSSMTQVSVSNFPFAFFEIRSSASDIKGKITHIHTESASTTIPSAHAN